MIESLSTEEKQEFKALRIVFISIASCVILLLLGAIVFGQLHGPLAPELNEYRNWLLGGAAIFSFGCSVLGKRLFTRAVETAKTSPNPLSVKLGKYRAALIVYLAMSELPIILCILLSVMTGNFIFQVYAAVLIGFLLSSIPRQEKVIAQLQG